LKFHHKVAIGLVAGIAAGVLFGPRAAVLEPLGTLFIKAIRMVVVPLIASTLVMAIAGLPGRAALGRMGLRAFGFFLASLLLALLVGIAFGLVFEPGSRLSPEVRERLLEGQNAPIVDPGAARPSLVDTLLAVVPDNPFRAAVEGNVLQVSSLPFSSACRERASDVDETSGRRRDERRRGPLQVTLIPSAPFGFQNRMAASRTLGSVLWILGAYVLVVLRPRRSHRRMGSVPSRSREENRRFVAPRAPLPHRVRHCSTAAALPVSLKRMENDMGISPRVASFVLPLGAAVGRDGSAIYQAVTVLFVAQVYGVEIGFSGLVTLVVTAMLAALAVASIPAAGFASPSFFPRSGLPLEGGSRLRRREAARHVPLVDEPPRPAHGRRSSTPPSGRSLKISNLRG
jgi:Na+/serine symporter